MEKAFVLMAYAYIIGFDSTVFSPYVAVLLKVLFCFLKGGFKRHTGTGER
jgi:hypothetical protein